jgi:hypothetical protein
MTRGPLSQSEFAEIFSKVPRLTVEIILVSTKGVLFTKRQIEPCKGMWHMPGGTVRFGEPLTDAVHRVGGQELGNKLIVDDFLGYIEYPSHYNEGLDSPVGMAFKTSLQGMISDFELDDNTQWFTRLPDNMHEEQKRFLIDNQILKI